MKTINEIVEEIVNFRNSRDWKQFHNPKDMALSLVLEAGEVMEHFQWKNKKEMKSHIRNNKNEIAKELADVLYWILLMSHDFKIDILKALRDKMRENAKKYPVSKSRGKHTKYSKL